MAAKLFLVASEQPKSRIEGLERLRLHAFHVMPYVNTNPRPSSEVRECVIEREKLHETF
jgi:hypothetical protein